MAPARKRLPRPFLKWAGGKAATCERILKDLPAKIDTYVEPFLGGGAVFFELVRQQRIRRAILADRNAALIEVYEVVRDHAESLLVAARQWPATKEVYYDVRATEPESLDAITRAARVLYLNKTGFNGLYRLNSKGRFNVPFGLYTNPKVVDEDNILACSRALEHVELIAADFESVLAAAPAGAVVYCDPPYWPVSKTANFSCYDGHPFREPDQMRLARAFRSLGERDIGGLLSNSCTDETLALYAGLKVSRVRVRRPINRDPKRRGEVEELLVRTAL